MKIGLIRANGNALCLIGQLSHRGRRQKSRNIPAIASTAHMTRDPYFTVRRHNYSIFMLDHADAGGLGLIKATLRTASETFAARVLEQEHGRRGVGRASGRRHLPKGKR
jgi:hypothetical protein